MTVRADETPRDAAGERPLRRDAERNRQRILAAAAGVFTERGLDATLDEVARAAGVGIGTVYRRFPDKDALVSELFRDRIDALVTVAEQACTAPDPWQGLVTYLEYAAAAMAGDLGLRQLMMFATYDRDRVCYARDRMRPVMTRLVERAQAAGDLRPDFQPTDVKMIAFMLASIAEYAASVTPEVWRRYLAMLVDGLRPSRDGVSELPAPAPTATELSDILSAPAQRLSPRFRLPAPGAARAGPGTGPAPRARAYARAFSRAFSGASILCTIRMHER
ncbi:MAG: TetR/AcrR family transcriptional regulator [Trebonia sp.]